MSRKYDKWTKNFWYELSSTLQKGLKLRLEPVVHPAPRADLSVREDRRVL